MVMVSRDHNHTRKEVILVIVIGCALIAFAFGYYNGYVMGKRDGYREYEVKEAKEYYDAISKLF